MTSNGRLVIEIPLKNEEKRSSDLFPKISEDNKNISINLSLPECTDPTKINVTCKDRNLIVKYEDKTEKDDSFSSIYFYEQVFLPENTQFNDLNCKYENNILSISAPINADLDKKNPISIPIYVKNQINS
jgi:HSP20 family molecular chaperone IbpA